MYINTIFDSPHIVLGNLTTEIILVGYKTQGESIIIRVIDDKKQTHLCGVVDCYDSENISKTEDYLKRFNIDKLDFLFWTHPDYDHSLGMDKIIENYLPDKIGVLGISSGICLSEIKNSLNQEDSTNAIYKCFKSIEKASYKLKSNFYNIEHGTGEFIAEFMLNGEVNTFKIVPFAPLSYISRGNSINSFKHLLSDDNKYTEKKNKISIGLLIMFNNRKVCLTGDIVNDALNDNKHNDKLKKLFNGISFFKIPHHGGKSSDIFLKLVPGTIEFAGVTTYHDTNPSQEILCKYIDKSNKLYCTSNIRNKNSNSEDYGIIKLKIPFEDYKQIEVSTEGDAMQITEKE